MHKEKKICDSIVQCPMCRKEFEPSASKEPQQCYFDKCFVCHEYVKATEHKCFIQPVAAKEDQRKKKTKATLKHQRKKVPWPRCDVLSLFILFYGLHSVSFLE